MCSTMLRCLRWDSTTRIQKFEASSIDSESIADSDDQLDESSTGAPSSKFLRFRRWFSKQFTKVFGCCMKPQGKTHELRFLQRSPKPHRPVQLSPIPTSSSRKDFLDIAETCQEMKTLSPRLVRTVSYADLPGAVPDEDVIWVKHEGKMRLRRVIPGSPKSLSRNEKSRAICYKTPEASKVQLKSDSVSPKLSNTRSPREIPRPTPGSRPGSPTCNAESSLGHDHTQSKVVSKNWNRKSNNNRPRVISSTNDPGIFGKFKSYQRVGDHTQPAELVSMQRHERSSIRDAMTVNFLVMDILDRVEKLREQSPEKPEMTPASTDLKTQGVPGSGVLSLKQNAGHVAQELPLTQIENEKQHGLRLSPSAIKINDIVGSESSSPEQINKNSTKQQIGNDNVDQKLQQDISDILGSQPSSPELIAGGTDQAVFNECDEEIKISFLEKDRTDQNTKNVEQAFQQPLKPNHSKPQNHSKSLLAAQGSQKSPNSWTLKDNNESNAKPSPPSSISTSIQEILGSQQSLPEPPPTRQANQSSIPPQILKSDNKRVDMPSLSPTATDIKEILGMQSNSTKPAKKNESNQDKPASSQSATNMEYIFESPEIMTRSISLSSDAEGDLLCSISDEELNAAIFDIFNDTDDISNQKAVQEHKSSIKDKRELTVKQVSPPTEQRVKNTICFQSSATERLNTQKKERSPCTAEPTKSAASSTSASSLYSSLTEGVLLWSNSDDDLDAAISEIFNKVEEISNQKEQKECEKSATHGTVPCGREQNVKPASSQIEQDVLNILEYQSASTKPLNVQSLYREQYIASILGSEANSPEPQDTNKRHRVTVAETRQTKSLPKTTKQFDSCRLSHSQVKQTTEKHEVQRMNENSTAASTGDNIQKATFQSNADSVSRPVIDESIAKFQAWTEKSNESPKLYGPHDLRPSHTFPIPDQSFPRRVDDLIITDYCRNVIRPKGSKGRRKPVEKVASRHHNAKKQDGNARASGSAQKSISMSSSSISFLSEVEDSLLSCNSAGTFEIKSQDELDAAILDILNTTADISKQIVGKTEERASTSCNLKGTEMQNTGHSSKKSADAANILVSKSSALEPQAEQISEKPASHDDSARKSVTDGSHKQFQAWTAKLDTCKRDESHDMALSRKSSNVCKSYAVNDCNIIDYCRNGARPKGSRGRRKREKSFSSPPNNIKTEKKIPSISGSKHILESSNTKNKKVCTPRSGEISNLRCSSSISFLPEEDLFNFNPEMQQIKAGPINGSETMDQTRGTRM